MARTPEQVLRDIIGAQTIQIAALMAQLEEAREKLAKAETP